jgi:hypothetical protein
MPMLRQAWTYRAVMPRQFALRSDQISFKVRVLDPS